MATSRVPLASKDGRSINIWIQHACLEGLATCVCRFVRLWLQAQKIDLTRFGMT